MKLYLSSYQLGDQANRFKALIPVKNKKTAYISNALDFSSDLERRQKSEQSDIIQLKKLGLNIEIIDLRNYFYQQETLEKNTPIRSNLD